MEEITIKYWSPHGRQEEKKFRCEDKKIDLTMRAAKKVDLSDLTRCNSLVTLNLANNMLDELDLSPLSQNRTITEIRLENNNLKFLNLWPLGRCTTLVRLTLTQNKLEQLDITPVLPHLQILLDSSVVITSDFILRYFLTNNELSERFLLVRPDRAPWKAPPVLIWTSYDELAKTMDWSTIRERIMLVLEQVSEKDWYATQRGLLTGLGMEELAGYDGDPMNLIEVTSDTMDYESAKRVIFNRTIELLEEQIANQGSTLFLETEAMKKTRASKLIAKIIAARKKEIENTTVLTKGSISLLNSLWITHYGYKILEAMGVGIRHFGIAIEEVKRSLEELDLTLKTEEVNSLEIAEIDLPIVASHSMRNFVYNQIENAYQ